MKPRTIHVDLSGKVALVTGGASGIGEAIAMSLAANGAAVAIHYHTSEGRANQLVEQFRRNGTQAVAIQADVTAPEEIERMFKRTQEQMGANVDILVNNAGTPLALGHVEDMPLERWSQSLALNLTSTMLCCKCALPGMKKTGWGRIINISSISARSGGGPGETSYAAAKGGLSTFTKGLAKELGTTGTTVNAIAPGIILTRIHEKFSPKEKLEQLRKMTPLGRLGQPEDIAGAALFLASDSASYLTGETIAINGGLRMD